MKFKIEFEREDEIPKIIANQILKNEDKIFNADKFNLKGCLITNMIADNKITFEFVADCIEGTK